MSEKSNKPMSRTAALSLLGIGASAAVLLGSIKNYFSPDTPATAQTVQMETPGSEVSGDQQVGGRTYRKMSRADMAPHEAQSTRMTEEGASQSSGDTQSLDMVGGGRSLTRAELNALKQQRRQR